MAMPSEATTNDSLTVTNTTESGEAQARCDSTLETTFMVLNSVTGAVILPGNILVLVVILSKQRLRQQQMNIFLASLALSDIVMGGFVVPGYSLFCVGCSAYPLSKYCWFLRGPKDVALGSSIYSVLAISYDRCLAVYWPLKYATITTKRRMISILSTVWGVSLLIALIRNFWQHTTTGAEFDAHNGRYNLVLLVVVLLIPLVTVSVVNFALIFTIRRQAHQVGANCRGQPANEASDSTEKNQMEMRRRRKGTIACILVVGVFVLFWIPRMVFIITYQFKGDFALVNKLLIKISIYFLSLQSSFNPFIYSLYRGEFRQAAIKLLSCNRN